MIRRSVRAAAVVFSTALALMATISITACGGGGGGGEEDRHRRSAIPPPGCRTRVPSSASYEAEVPIVPNTPTVGGGPVSSGGVSAPRRPRARHGRRGVITGTPSVAPLGVYLVSASNADGARRRPFRSRVLVARTASPPRRPSTTPTSATCSRAPTSAGSGRLPRGERRRHPRYGRRDDRLPARPALETAAEASSCGPDDPPGLEGGFPSHAQLAQWWLYLMIGTRTPFQERLALFWHDHFARPRRPRGQAPRAGWQGPREPVPEAGTGTSARCSLDMRRDWMMLRGSTASSSTKAGTNENFAREFWELFTLGVDKGLHAGRHRRGRARLHRLPRRASTRRRTGPSSSSTPTATTRERRRSSA